jgi:multidrug efflux pump
MSSSRSHNQNPAEIRNTSRFCIENPQIAWVLLVGTLIWGIYGFTHMPQRKDPDVPVKQAMVVTKWPGASAEKVEELVTRTVEKTIASNSSVASIESTSRGNVSTITFQLAGNLKQTGQVLDDIGGRLAAIDDLPDGAGPVDYIRDFGDTATLMLTVASPKADAAEVSVRAQVIQKAIEEVRTTGVAEVTRLNAGDVNAVPSQFVLLGKGDRAKSARRSTGSVRDNPLLISRLYASQGGETQRASLVFCFSPKTDRRLIRLAGQDLMEFLRSREAASDLRLFEGTGFIGIDSQTTLSNEQMFHVMGQFLSANYPQSQVHPDLWAPFIVRDPTETQKALAAVAGDKYSYRELDDFTDTMEKALLATARKGEDAPLVAKVSRSGILPERIYLIYSQERLASYGLKRQGLANLFRERNLTVAGGELDAGSKRLFINPSGEFRTEEEIGGVTIGKTAYGTPLSLRDVADTVRDYESPARFLNFYNWQDTHGNWQRTRAITVAVQMGTGQQVSQFATAVDATLEDLQSRLPKDLVIARTSDQPKQVEENVELFMMSLYEAVALVVLVSLIGFWEWRSALLMALSIPLTLLMTFGMTSLLGIDLQQVSIASLIIALGLLVDDPVVAGDAIKRELAAGQPRGLAAWFGPTKLATAIVYATITNIVAYLPFLLLPGTTGQFLYSLPVVMTCSLVASRVVSMTFIPLLGYYLLRGRPEPSIEERRKRGFAARYYKLGQWAIQHRWWVMAGAILILVVGGTIGKALKQQFFPKDLSQLAFVNIFLPEDAPLGLTNEAVTHVESIAQEVAVREKRPLESLTSFVGGGAPRFWYSLSPEPQHPNYAQIVLLFKDKHDTHHMLPMIQERVSREVAGARIDVRQLETGDAVGLPIAVRVMGEDIATLQKTAASIKEIFKRIPQAARVRDSWGEDRFNVELAIDPDRANLAGITNRDVAEASARGVNGEAVTTLREGDKQIPVMARLRLNQRARLDDVNNLYVYPSTGKQGVPLRQISRLDYSFRNEVITRRNQFRTITISAAPRDGVLASEVMALARPKLQAVAASLPPGFKFEIAGEEEKQKDSFGDLVVVLAISVASIFMALTFQFKNAVKPFIVFAAVPFGAVGALFGLWAMGSPFGFMGFLGVVSLVGVIVSHIIVLFDFIEEKHAEGERFEQAVLDAGIMRLRPVMITVGATVIALFPLAAHGGPLWEPLCYAQIGGLTAATFVTLLLVPVFYTICVLDLKIVKWDGAAANESPLPKPYVEAGSIPSAAAQLG